MRLTGFSLTLAVPTTAVPLTAIRQLPRAGDGAADLAGAAFWRAGAVKVAPDLTVPPAVVAFVGRLGRRRAGGRGARCAGGSTRGRRDAGSRRRGRPQEGDRARGALIAVAGVGREADAEAVAVRLALGHVAQRDARQRRQLAGVHDRGGALRGDVAHLEVELARQRRGGQPGRPEGEGAGRVADVRHVDVARAHVARAPCRSAVRIAAPASGEPMSGPVALPTAARAAPWSPPKQAAKAMPRAASAMARRERAAAIRSPRPTSVSV